ncbi:hypothetical protein JTB14_009668 [Gonioctena quinquepunctata]|nr:hypothetical protein JTB14_009668 [Gonioctena quinquepunctata]
MYGSSRSSYILSLLDVNNRNDHDPDDPLPLAAIIASTPMAAPVVDFDRNNSEEHDNSYVLTELSPVKLTNFDNSVSHEHVSPIPYCQQAKTNLLKTYNRNKPEI